MDTRREFLSATSMAGGGALSPENRIGRAPLRADNTADFIYGTRLLLSCDLTAARTHTGASVRWGTREGRGERETGSVQV